MDHQMIRIFAHFSGKNGVEMSRSLMTIFLILSAFSADAAPAKPAPRPGEEKLTQEHFDQIQDGMTKAQVLEILGNNRSSATQGKDVTLGWYFSGDGLHRAEVHFKDGVVISKHSAIDWKKHGVATTQPAAAAKAPATAPADEYAPIIAALRSTDVKRIRRALETLAKLPRDEERAGEISLMIERFFGSKDQLLKMAARDALIEWCTPENGPYFIKILEKHARSDARRAENNDQDFAMQILTRIKEPNAAAPIAKLLTRFFDRKQASESLIALGPELAQAEVLKYANHKDPDVAMAARKILDEFKTTPAALLDRNIADLKSTTADKRLWAAQAIEKMDVIPTRRKEVAAALGPLLADKYAWPAHAAAAALAKWGTAENEPELIKALAHASPDMRRLAANALKNVGTKQSLPALEKCVTKPDPVHPETATAAREAIAAIKVRG
jgi:HEAT repeat protein